MIAGEAADEAVRQQLVMLNTQRMSWWMLLEGVGSWEGFERS